MARIIAIAGLKGGAAKTTLAVNLAAALSGRQSVRLLDCDPQESATEWLAAGSLPIPHKAMPLEDERRAADWIRYVRAIDADVVVLDLPPQVGPVTAAGLIVCTLAVIPITPSSLDIRAAGKVLDLVRDARAERQDGGPAVLLVPSRVDRRTSAGREIEAALHEMGEPVGPAVGARSAFVDSATAGEWVGSFAPRSAAHAEIAALAAVVNRTSRRIYGKQDHVGTEKPRDDH